eukprot:4513926-Pyramimonas_sp.AAC.1
MGPSAEFYGRGGPSSVPGSEGIAPCAPPCLRASSGKGERRSRANGHCCLARAKAASKAWAIWPGE